MHPNVCSLQVKNNFQGTGNSKKEAKHKAATSMLVKLHQDVNRAPGAPSLIKTRETVRQQSHDLSLMQPDEISNPVGLLQELMQKNGLARVTQPTHIFLSFANKMIFPDYLISTI